MELPCHLGYVVTLIAAIPVVANNDVSFDDFNAAKNSNSSTESNQTFNNSTVQIFNVSSLEEICIEVGIPLELCSCEAEPDLCPVESEFETKFESTTLSTSSISNLVLVIISTICLFLGIVGNSAVLSVSFIERKNLVKSKKLIMQMALVDLICCIAVFVLSLNHYWTDKWVLGLAMCKFINGLAALGTMLPVGYMFIIALDRFFGIIYPLHKNLVGTKITYTYVTLNVTIGIGTVVPLFFSFEISEGGICELKWSGGKPAELIYNWFLMIFYFAVPIVITAALYSIIMRSLSQQVRFNASVRREDILRKRRQNNRRIMKILVAILVAFVICVLPTRVIHLYYAYTTNDGVTTAKSFRELQVLAYINNLTYPLHTVVNPLIYSAIDQKWRNKVLAIIGIKRKGKIFTDNMSMKSTTAANTHFQET